MDDSCKCDYPVGNIEGDDEKNVNTEDDTINLWDLRRNLERNIVAFRKESQETYCLINGGRISGECYDSYT